MEKHESCLQFKDCPRYEKTAQLEEEFEVFRRNNSVDHGKVVTSLKWTNWIGVTLVGAMMTMLGFMVDIQDRQATMRQEAYNRSALAMTQLYNYEKAGDQRAARYDRRIYEVNAAVQRIENYVSGDTP